MSVPPNMMSAGPAIPPPPGMGMVAPPMPMLAGASGGQVAPAVAALPGVANLAQQQSQQMMEHQKQMAMMQEQMQKEIMMLIASLPTPNPAGEAAVTAPLTPMMAGNNMSGSGAPAAGSPQAPMMNGMPGGGAPTPGSPSAY